ncbi:ABC transporter substrate-binding protein [Yinghuangia soli]|uniref:ABC transporter substrate-binding protein n=1 Tax=Yinghuangia soli TaxID=2908204 RepID=A0AA41Q165_9ACTN|nr:ABC transporter substrate-binding protein [Yinghuangia soli]MCF2528891.1 ABC transporter substrate-binding protein [Yinghuangia soli]
MTTHARTPRHPRTPRHLHSLRHPHALRRRRTPRLALALLAATALVATGCAAESDSSKIRPQSSWQAVASGPGVDDKVVRLGALTDLSGVYATLGKSLTQAQQLYFERFNAAGGVCGRKVELVVRDHGYDVKRGAAAYAEIAPQIAGLPQLLGSPVVGAVLPDLARDRLLAIPAAWPSSMLKEKYVQIVGATYDIEMINGVGFLLQEGRIAAGDKIGHIYFEGEYGENALTGARYAAEQAGLTLVEQRIKATDADMAAQVAALKRAGVKAILMSTGPKQSASAAGTAAAVGLNVPIVSNNPGFSPQLLATPAAAALQKNFYVVNAVQTANAQVSGVIELVSAYQARYPDAPLDSAVSLGWVTAKVFGDSLKRACDAKDLTREGILAALHTIDQFDSGGVTAVLDFSKIGHVGTRQSFIQMPDANAKGGLAGIAGPLPSQMAMQYPMPGQT